MAQDEVWRSEHVDAIVAENLASSTIVAAPLDHDFDSDSIGHYLRGRWGVVIRSSRFPVLRVFSGLSALREFVSGALEADLSLFAGLNRLVETPTRRIAIQRDGLLDMGTNRPLETVFRLDARADLCAVLRQRLRKAQCGHALSGEQENLYEVHLYVPPDIFEERTRSQILARELGIWWQAFFVKPHCAPLRIEAMLGSYMRAKPGSVQNNAAQMIEILASAGITANRIRVELPFNPHGSARHIRTQEISSFVEAHIKCRAQDPALGPLFCADSGTEYSHQLDTSSFRPSKAGEFYATFRGLPGQTDVTLERVAALERHIESFSHIERISTQHELLVLDQNF